ncbi:PorV/PorQ family protein [Nafulsella turpanensis]|uniref:hypothetical protein n=1 Tax=Nafulsella turpanensis TaxID=1265690 RepID=UPI00034B6140|nr:hypothetical protein [Nafulsella turpanensis]
MLRNCLFIFSFFLLAIPFAHGQVYPAISGARAAALGHASVGLSDIWAILNNIGSLADVEAPAVAFGYQTRFQLQELSTLGALIAWPLPTGVLGGSVSRFGTGIYSVHSAGIGYSHKINYISVGIKLNYLQQAIETVGSHGNFVAELGGKAMLLPKLHFAAHVYNISQSHVSRRSEERLPTLLTAGLSYLPSDKLQLYVQTRKNVEFPARFSAGLEYAIIPALTVRTGIRTRPVEGSFGLGFQIRRLHFNYA